MKKMKSTSGFTLVELIVVIAILAILAGIAVPAYSGYIKSANDAAVETQLGAIKTAAMGANATSGEVDKIEVTSATTVKVTSTNELATNFDDDFAAFYTDTTAVTIAADKKSADITINAIDNWNDSSYAEAPTDKNAGATWENGKWSEGVAK